MEESKVDIEESNIILEDIKRSMESNYNLAIDYYSKENPFKKVIIGTTIGGVGSFSTMIIAMGISTAYVTTGGVLVYDTAFLVAGFGGLFGLISVIVTVPAIIGGVIYSIYKMVKTSKLEDYMNKLSNLKDNSMKEEREIFGLLMSKCLEYFEIYIKKNFLNNIKAKIIRKTKEIIDEIKTNRKKKERK